MNSKYSFVRLLNRREVDPLNKSKLFGKMIEFTRGRSAIGHSDSLVWLREQLGVGELLVGHYLVRFKGKTPIFDGMLVIADSECFIDYLRSSIQSDDLRSLLVAPTFDTDPKLVVHVSEDAVFSKYEM